MNLIYQVYVGKRNNLYDTCTQSVRAYAKRIGAAYYIQTEPILAIKPNPKRTGRSLEAVDEVLGLPIFEKENGFSYLSEYEKVCVIDADVYVPYSTRDSIFDELQGKPFAAMVEASLPMLPWYKQKLITYSAMQYGRRGCQWPRSMFDMNTEIALFRNMGVMLFDRQICRYDKYLPDNQREFILQEKFSKFVDGVGNFKWSTDQTLLNHWLYEEQIPTADLDWRWNCLYKTVDNDSLQEAKFIHFFLKDKLPQKGENIQELLKEIGR